MRIGKCLTETIDSVRHESLHTRHKNIEASDRQRLLDFHRDLGFVNAPDLLGILAPSLTPQTTSIRRLALVR